MKLRFSSVVLFVVLTLGAFFYARERLFLENDLVSSLKAGDADLAAVFERFHGSGLFRGKIFLDLAKVSDEDRVHVSALLAQEGFKPISLVALPQEPQAMADAARNLALHLPQHTLARVVSDDALAFRAEEILSTLLLPGGEAFGDLAKSDPLGLLPLTLQAFWGTAESPSSKLSASQDGPSGNSQVRAYLSPRPLDFEKIARVHDALSKTNGAHFIGEDFFAYENYAIVRRDILVCTLLGLPLNLLLYLFFVRDRRFLFFTLAGNIVSYAWGLFFGTLFFQGLYGVALAFTTTFLSFNNESLVHLAGVDANATRDKKLGLLSAMGTTFLGFLVLLVGSSSLVRQIALLSLGGMTGFLAFLWVFRKTLARLSFREAGWLFEKSSIQVRMPLLLVLCAACVVAVVVGGFPGIGTRIREFRSFSTKLESDIAHFTSKADGLAGGRPFALELSEAPDVTGAQATPSLLASWRQAGKLSARSPWAVYADFETQKTNAEFLSQEGSRAVLTLRTQGVDLGLDAAGFQASYANTAPQSPAAFCEALEGFSPLRLCARAPSGAFFAIVSGSASASDSFAGEPSDSEKKEGGPGERVWGLEAEPFYDAILTGFSRELAWLFLAGLGAMALYLYSLHRSWRALVYIFLPVVLSGAVVCLWLGMRGEPLNVIHMLAFSLVIAVGVDYSSVALSSRYATPELSRVLLTGLSTLAAFGALVAARHPVLRDLGMVVSLGAGMSLAFALFIRVRLEPAATPAVATAEGEVSVLS